LLATDPAAAAYVAEQIQPLREWGMVMLLDVETEIAPGVRAIQSPGHSPGHMSLWIKTSHGKNLLIAGDAFYHPLQVTQPTQHFGADGDAKRANTTRSQLLERFAHQDLILAACHFPEPGLGHVCYDGQERYWQPI
jgi:glyoxylase-like metal-dependent hydrolase (beta-lactamase superfamily II)